MALQPERPSGGRVRVVKDAGGRVVGFQDPDRNNVFIKRSEALKRVEYDVQSQTVKDSFGGTLGIADLVFPKRGQTVAYAVKEAEYQRLLQDPRAFRPSPNQEVIERVVVVTADGKFKSVETSYGLGQRFDPAKAGGRFRAGVATAEGVPVSKRLPTKDLERAIVFSEFLVKTTRTR